SYVAGASTGRASDQRKRCEGSNECEQRRSFKRRNQIQDFLISLAINAAFPSQLEFEMLFRSVRVQHLPLFDQVIAIYTPALLICRREPGLWQSSPFRPPASGNHR